MSPKPSDPPSTGALSDHAQRTTEVLGSLAASLTTVRERIYDSDVEDLVETLTTLAADARAAIDAGKRRNATRRPSMWETERGRTRMLRALARAAFMKGRGADTYVQTKFDAASDDGVAWAIRGAAVECTKGEWERACEDAATRAEEATDDDDFMLTSIETTELMAASTSAPVESDEAAYLLGVPVMPSDLDDVPRSRKLAFAARGDDLYAVEDVGVGFLRVRMIGRRLGGSIVPDRTRSDDGDGRVVPVPVPLAAERVRRVPPR